MKESCVFHRRIDRSRWNAYHGATLGALSATGKTSMREPFLPLPFRSSIFWKVKIWWNRQSVGVIYKCTGFSNGDGDAIMLGPPFIISESEIDLSVHAIQQVLNRL